MIKNIFIYNFFIKFSNIFTDLHAWNRLQAGTTGVKILHRSAYQI